MAFDLGKIFGELAPTAKDVFKSFVSKGTLDNVTWLAQTFAKNKETAQEAAQLTQDIYDTVTRFSTNMRSIQQAKSKEQWLKAVIENSNLTEQQKSEYITQATIALGVGNQMMNAVMQSPIIADLQQISTQILAQDSPAGNASLNRYERAPFAEQLGQQAALMGSNGLIFPSEMPAIQGEEILQQDITEEKLGSTFDEGLKLAASAAIKIGHAAGKIPFLPKALPVSAITNIACVGVESFKNIGRVATGKITPLQAVENIGRASVVAIADFCTTGIPAKLLMPVPVVGPVLSLAVGGFLMQASPEYIQQKIYAGINKVKSTATNVKNSICNFLFGSKETTPPISVSVPQLQKQ